ncbi:MAG: restriction endonuclease [Candidatus Lambdaproteobacteria bacterium]|nr:restriction endonuclease [Candidatus Lambdaproteobacteria bacterium]
MTARIKETSKSKGDEFERRIAALFAARQIQVDWPKPNNKHFDFTLTTKQGTRYAVQAKAYEKSLPLNSVKSFAAFMNSPEAGVFARGLLISTSGITSGGKKFIDQNPQARIKFYRFREDNIYQTAGDSEVEQKHIGIYTFKGGVGKTKVCLLFSAALAYKGEDVLAVDLNRAHNLTNLIGLGGIYVKGESGSGNTVVVYTNDEWKKEPIRNINFIIYDCPQFFEKPAERKIIERFDYVLSPVNLTLDSMGLDYTVITDTIREIRALNDHAHILFFCNDCTPEQTGGMLRKYFLGAQSHLGPNPRVHFIDPAQFSIAHSKELEEIGLNRLMDRSRKIELMFASHPSKESPWGRLLDLADFILRSTNRFNP